MSYTNEEIEANRQAIMDSYTEENPNMNIGFCNIPWPYLPEMHSSVWFFNKGIHTIKELAETTEAVLETIRGVGPKKIIKIKEALASVGYTLGEKIIDADPLTTIEYLNKIENKMEELQRLVDEVSANSRVVEELDRRILELQELMAQAKSSLGQ